MTDARDYTISQTREVKVTAHNIADAITIAHSAFENDRDNPKHDGQDVWGNITTDVIQVNVSYREDL